jgi:hypothetical protein
MRRGVDVAVRARADHRPFGSVSFMTSLIAVAVVVIALAQVTLTVVVLAIALRLRSLDEQTSRLMVRAEGDLLPLVRRIDAIAEDAKEVTAAVRVNVDRVSATVAAADDRVRDALALTEERLDDFNALLRVVQEEAEEIFVSTAATVRGVRQGVAAFRDRGGHAGDAARSARRGRDGRHTTGARDGTDLASDEPDSATPADDIELEEEMDDGHDDDPASRDAATTAAPRLSPRAARRRA